MADLREMIRALTPTVPLPGGLNTATSAMGIDARGDVLVYQPPDVIEYFGAGGPFLPLSGGQLTGPLLLAGPPVQPLGAATRQYVDAAVATALPVSGGTMLGPLIVTATGGNTPISVQDRFAQVFNVRDYGVRMDGVTDDSAALSACVAAAGSNPGTVLYFPPSTQPLMLGSGVGALDNQVWWAYPGSVTIMPTPGNTGTVLLVGYANNVWVSGLTFDGGGPDFPSGNPLTQAFRLNGVTLDRVTFQNTHGMPFNGTGVNDLVVRDCRFVNCGNHWRTTGSWDDAVQALTNSTGDGVTWGFRTKVIDCTFSENGCDCINLGGIVDVQIIGNTFVSTSRPWDEGMAAAAYFAAVFPLACSNVVIADNLMLGMSGNAIDAPGLWEGVISNNTIRNSGQLGIGIFSNIQYVGAYPPLRGSRNITITGNVIENSNQWGGGIFHDGIVVAGDVGGATSNVRITNNVITDTQAVKTQEYGVSASGTFTGIWLDPSNQLAGNATGPANGLPLAGLAMDDAGNLFTPGPLLITGNETVTGTLVAYDAAVGFNGATSLSFRLNAAGNAWRTMHWQTAGLDRWQFLTTGSGESGSNTGSDFAIYAIADDGNTNVLGTAAALYITRATGAVSMGGHFLPPLVDAASDAAAAAGGVPVGALYQNAGVVHVRLI